jgi:hypothetical protein
MLCGFGKCSKQGRGKIYGNLNFSDREGQQKYCKTKQSIIFGKTIKNYCRTSMIKQIVPAFLYRYVEKI